MGKKIVGMLSSYQNLNPSPIDWLWEQTPDYFGSWGNIEIQAQASTPDFLLMYQFDFYQNHPLKNSWLRRFQRRQPPVLIEVPSKLRGVPKERIIYLLREPPLDEVVEKHKVAYEQAKNYCGYISGPDDFAPVPDYMPAIWYISKSFRELNEMASPPKVKPCSWITSGINRTINHRQRLDFVRLLQSSGLQFDLYGRNLPNWAENFGAIGGKANGMVWLHTITIWQSRTMLKMTGT